MSGNESVRRRAIEMVYALSTRHDVPWFQEWVCDIAGAMLLKDWGRTEDLIRSAAKRLVGEISAKRTGGPYRSLISG